MKGISACTMDCPDSCSLVVEEKEDGRTIIRGNPDHPFTNGFCCSKGVGYIKHLRSPNRITRPMLKENGELKPVSWDRALDLCADKISLYRQNPEQILHIHGHGTRGIFWEAGTILFRGLGAASTYGSFCDDTGIEACIRDFGSLHHNDPLDLVNATAIVNWGKDFSRSSIHTAALVKEARDKGARVLTVTPGGDGAEKYSDQVINLRPGTDRFLAAAVIKLLIERNKISRSITDRTANWKVFRDLLDGRDPEELLAAADLDRRAAEAVLSVYDRPEPVATIIGWGLQRHEFGGENVRFINALALLAGHVGRLGGGSYFNIASSRNFTPFAHQYGEYGRRLLIQDIGREILEADPPVKLIWVDCLNVVNQVPDCGAVARAFEKTDFVVVVEAFMNDTAMRADLILPPVLMMEREDLVGSAMHNYVNYSGKIFDPPPEARTDYEIAALLGRRLDPPILLPGPEECVEQALKNSKTGMSFQEIKARGFARVEYPNPAYENLVFDHPDGKYRFSEELHDRAGDDPDYPLHLLTLVNGKYIHSQIPEEEQNGPPRVMISPRNPMLASLRQDLPVYLATSSGRLAVKLEYDAGVRPDTIIIRRGGWMKHGLNVNPIIRPSLTDMGFGTAQYSQKACLEN